MMNKRRQESSLNSRLKNMKKQRRQPKKLEKNSMQLLIPFLQFQIKSQF